MYHSNLEILFIFVLILSLQINKTGNFRIDRNCVPPRGDVCITIRKCPYFLELLDNSPIPRPRPVIKIIKEHQCGFDSHTPKVCCFVNDSEDAKIKADQITLKNVKTSKILNKDKVNLLPMSNCGVVSKDFRITGGTEASLLEFPWMSLIAYETNEGLDFRCSGTVLNERYILTAAHCLQNLTFIGVRLGEYDISKKRDCDVIKGFCSPPVQDFYIENIRVHPGYDPSTFNNDLALIRLATSANLTYVNVKPICLPIDDSLNLDGKFAVITGWGVTNAGQKSPKLLKTSVPVISNEECQKIYYDYASITKKQICAGGYLGRDSCGGDSGGPLQYVTMVNGISRFVQYGIVSYGPKQCGIDGQPGVYTKISEYIDWILENLEPFED